MEAVLKQNPVPPAGDFGALFQMKTMTLTFSLKKQGELMMLGLWPDRAGAEAGVKALDTVKGFIGMAFGQQDQPPVRLFKPAIDNLKVLQEGAEVVLTSKFDVKAKDLSDTLKEALLVRQSAERSQTQGHFKQLAIAMHSYHDVEGHLPPQASVDQKQKPLHSWRVHLLPYIEEGELYKKIRLNEPWDSPHNKQFHNQMPRIFRGPGRQAGEGKTFVQVLVGKETAFPGPGVPMKFAGITDGLSNTILLVEAREAVNWMEPRDIPFASNPQGFSPANLGWPDADAFITAMCDGAVHTVPLSIMPKLLQAVITAAGGEPIDNFPPAR
jgi:hypothetical protein